MLRYSKNHSRWGRFFALSLIMLIIFSFFINPDPSAAAGGTTYYVAVNGSDNGNGSVSAPFRSIKQGMKVLKPGDTLMIYGGIYNEYIDIFNMNGSESQWYTIKSFPGESVTLNGSGAMDNSKQQALTFNNSSYWRIQGLRFTRYTGAGIYLKKDDNHFELSDLTIWNLDGPPGSTAGTEGIMGEGASYVTVKNCDIFQIGLQQDLEKDHGIYIGYGAHDWIFDGNRIHDNSGAGIHMSGEPTGGKNVTATNNYLFNNHNWGIVLSSHATGNVIRNNKFYGNSDCDAYLLNSSSGNTFDNNIFGSTATNYNVAIKDIASINNIFDSNTYGKKNDTVYYANDNQALSFAQWQGIPQEANGGYLVSASSLPLKVKNYTSQRLSGDSRFDTAKAIGEAYNNGTVQNVIITSGLNFPDALSGSVLAMHLNAPILLTGMTVAESGATLDYIKNHLDKNGNIYILGGPGVVGESFSQAFNSMGFENTKIIRLWGNDRYATNQEINNKLNPETGTPVIIASGQNFPDALSISSVAAHNGFPIILTDRDSLPAQAAETLSKINPAQVFIAGGTGVISDSVKASIQSMIHLSDSNVVRIAGSDRYETSIKIANYFRLDLSGNTATIANGENFPDALAGSVLAAKLKAPVLLVGGDGSKQKDYLDSYTNYTNEIIFGGSGAVSDKMAAQMVY